MDSPEKWFPDIIWGNQRKCAFRVALFFINGTMEKIGIIRCVECGDLVTQGTAGIGTFPCLVNMNGKKRGMYEDSLSYIGICVCVLWIGCVF
jgi:hypothetical protein